VQKKTQSFFCFSPGVLSIEQEKSFFKESNFMMIQQSSGDIVTNPPFFECIAIASFDIMSGIQLVERFFNTDPLITSQLDSLFRMTLSTVHRQEEHVFNDIFTSVLDISMSNWFVISSIFLHRAKPRDIYYGSYFILKSDIIPKNQHFIDCLLFYSKAFANSIKVQLTKSESLSKCKTLAFRFADDVISIFGTEQKGLPLYDFDTNEVGFYTQCLSAHLKNQMNTIIEASSHNDAQKMYNFLASFTLPSHLEYSSNQLRESAHPFLHIQCIEKQNTGPDDIMILSPIPCALIRLTEKQIFISPSITTHTTARNEYFDLLFHSFDVEDPEQKKKILKSRSHPIKPKSFTGSCTIAKEIMKVLMNSHQQYKQILCEQLISGLVRKSVTFISLVNDNLESINNTTISNEQLQEIIKTIGIRDNDDLEIIISFALLFDDRLMKKIHYQPKESRFLF